MLKWTYAYDHYLPLLYNDGDHVKQKKNFFEFLQGEDENILEWLHQCVEHDIQHYMDRVRKIETLKL